MLVNFKDCKIIEEALVGSLPTRDCILQRLVQGISIQAGYCLPKCLGLDYFRLSFLIFRIFAYTLLVVHCESKHLTCKMASSPKCFE